MKLSSADIVHLTEVYCAHNYHPLSVVIAEGRGVWVKDVEKRRYLDMLSAYGAMNFGHRNARLLRAARRQLSRMTLTSRAFYNDQLGPLAKDLTELCGLEMVLPMVTGAEAVETALKAARRWGYEVKDVPPGEAEIICFTGNFAGRTTTIVSFSDTEEYKRGFGPFTPGFVIAKYGDLESVRSLVSSKTVGVLVEPVQGEGGINVPPPGFLSGLRKVCDENRILLIADEVQTGMCRTGALFACDHEWVKPDLLVIGKSLGGGITPLSAVVGTKEVLGLLGPGSHGSTFGGNSLACAVAREVIALIKEDRFEERAREMGEYLMEGLRGLNAVRVKEVRGKGLMVGVELHEDAGPAIEYCEKLRNRGILCKDTRKQVLRLAPPLVVTRRQLDWALERIGAVLR